MTRRLVFLAGAGALVAVGACLVGIDESKITGGSGAAGSGGSASMCPPDAGAPLACPAGGTKIEVAGFTLAAIDAAIAASKDGDTISFPAGTYTLSDKVVLKSKRSYVGEPGAVLARSDSPIAEGEMASSDICIAGLTFEGGGLTFDNPPTTGLRVLGSTFREILDGKDAIYISFDNTGTVVDHSTFLHSKATALDLYNSTGLSITCNQFEAFDAPMNLVGSKSDVRIAWNVVREASGFTLHLNENGVASDNVSVDDNQFSGDPARSPNRVIWQQGGTGKNTTISDNSIDLRGVLVPDGGTGITLGGTGTVVERNVVRGPLDVGIGVEGASAVVKDNVICNEVGEAIDEIQTPAVDQPNTISTNCP